MLKNAKIGQALLISHVISALLVGFIFKFWKKDQLDLTFRNYKSESKDLIKISNLGEILSEAIKKSILTVLSIGGFVVLFSVIISILSSLHLLENISILLQFLGIPRNLSFGFLSGIIELTNGIKLTSNCFNSFPIISILIISFLLGFGGFSVLLQVFSIISKSKISIKSYFYGKILHALLSVIFTFLLLQV